MLRVGKIYERKTDRTRVEIIAVRNNRAWGFSLYTGTNTPMGVAHVYDKHSGKSIDLGDTFDLDLPLTLSKNVIQAYVRIREQNPSTTLEEALAEVIKVYEQEKKDDTRRECA